MNALERPPQILNRADEWERLSAIWASPRPELVFVTGARRVGKTHLLASVARQVDGLYYQATRRTETEQLSSLSALCGDRFDDPALLAGTMLPSWDAVFDYILRRAGAQSFLLVLDEYPYLEESTRGLASIIQRVWDHLPDGALLKLVLSGSHVSAMRRLDDADQPLHARRTRGMVLAPFTYHDAALFFPGYSSRDRLRAYAAFGGLPGNLAMLDPSMSLRENVIEQLLDPMARLHDEAERILDPFVTDGRVHYAILHAIADGNETWEGITRTVGLSSGSVSRPMRWLIDMGIVMREVPVSENDPERSRRSLYRLADPYLEFWMRNVRPLRTGGLAATTRASNLWESFVSRSYDNAMGRVFERACRTYVQLNQGLPFGPRRVGRWWTWDNSSEIDVVAVAEGSVLVGECKWGAVGMDDLNKLRRATSVLSSELGRTAAELGRPAAEVGRLGRVHEVLFSGSDEFSPTLRSAADAEGVILIGPDQLFDLESWQ